MTDIEAVEIIKVARAEVEWEYPIEYAAAFDRAVKALKRESCEDAISRQAVLDLCDSKDPEYKTFHLKEDVECLPSVNKTGWIPIRWKPFGKNGYPNPKDEYKHFLTLDNEGEITIQEFLLSLDEEPQPYFTGMRNVVAWTPLPEPYKPQESEENV